MHECASVVRIRHVVAWHCTYVEVFTFRDPAPTTVHYSHIWCLGQDKKNDYIVFYADAKINLHLCCSHMAYNMASHGLIQILSLIGSFEIPQRIWHAQGNAQY